MSFLVYRSSAGSGKTFTLVRQYLTISLSPPLPDHYRSVLAITFTNKAASEMKERVIRTFRNFSTGNNNAGSEIMAGLLEHDLGIDRATLRKRSAEILRHMLHHYSDLSISTIDKFTHRIIRSFAFDLNVPVNFEVELEEGDLLVYAADLLLEKTGTDDLITKVLTGYSLSRLEDDESWDIEGKLRKFARQLLDENTIKVIRSGALPQPEEVFELRNELQGNTKQFENRLMQFGLEGLKILNEAGIDPSGLAGGSRGIGGYLLDLSTRKKLMPTDTVKKYITERKFIPSKITSDQKSAIESATPALETLFNRILSQLDAYPQYILQKLILSNIYGTALLSQLSECLTEVKHRENVLPISEFNQILIEVVRKEPAPFIYERIGEKYQYFLIDEFQDTSVMQWHNLLPLLENGLASGYGSLVVGDAKQSIYRWRGGEFSQFINLPEVESSPDDELTPLRQQVIASNYKEEFLDQNYRSAPGIVSFNNDFFAIAGERIPGKLRAVYNNHQQKHRDGTDGFIRIECLGEKGLLKHEMQSLYIDRVCELIDELTQRGVPFCDIAVLVRDNKNGSALAGCLSEREVPVLSQESLHLQSSIRVRLLTGLMTWIESPENTGNNALLIQTLKQLGMASETASWMAIHDAGDFNTLLSDSGIDINPGELIRLPLYDLAESLIRAAGFSELADPFISGFLDCIHRYVKKKQEHLTPFLSWWNEKGGRTSINVPEGVNAVRILSIHKSKGLEFPVVIVPFAEWEGRSSRDQVWVDYQTEKGNRKFLVNFNKSLAEAGMEEIYDEEINQCLLDDLNLLYVAFTRPVNELFILTSGHPKSRSVANFIHDFLKKKELWNEEKNVYEIGKPCSYDHDKKPVSVHSYHFTSTSWPEFLAISNTAPSDWDPENPDSEISRGLVMHSLLSQCRTLDEAGGKIASLICQDDIRKWIADSMEKLIAQAGLKEIFEGDKVLAEREMITAEGNSFRPDRVVISGREARVIDFKTGLRNSSHEKQIRLYGGLLSEMGYENVRMFIIYISEPEIVEITDL